MGTPDIHISLRRFQPGLSTASGACQSARLAQLAGCSPQYIQTNKNSGCSRTFLESSPERVISLEQFTSPRALGFAPFGIPGSTEQQQCYYVPCSKETANMAQFQLFTRLDDCEACFLV